jgi:hypothetical protein
MLFLPEPGPAPDPALGPLFSLSPLKDCGNKISCYIAGKGLCLCFQELLFANQTILSLFAARKKQ